MSNTDEDKVLSIDNFALSLFSLIQQIEIKRIYINDCYKEKKENTISRFPKLPSQFLSPKSLKICVAISGGADSMSLLSLIQKLTIQYQCIHVIPIIVDHKIRQNSSEEALYVKNYIEDKFLTNAIILTLDKSTGLDQKMTQERARKQRYDLLTNYCKKNDIRYLCTAHNQDDNAETVILNMVRGSGISGICGIPEISMRDEVAIIRPLLRWKRADIEEYLKKNELKWVEDPSNYEEKYTRNKVRNFIRSLDDKSIVPHKLLVERICLLSKNLRSTKSYIDYSTEIAFFKTCQITEFGVIFLQHNTFIELHPEIQITLLKRILGFFSAKEDPIRSAKIESLLYKLSYEKIAEFQSTTLACCEIIKMAAANLKSQRTKIRNVVQQKINKIDSKIEDEAGSEIGNIRIAFIKEASNIQKQLYVIDLSTKEGRIVWDNNALVTYHVITDNNQKYTKIFFYPFYGLKQHNNPYIPQISHSIEINPSNGIDSLLIRNVKNEDMSQMRESRHNAIFDDYFNIKKNLGNIKKKNLIYRKIALTLPLILY